jgi:hypothetical protein
MTTAHNLVEALLGDEDMPHGAQGVCSPGDVRCDPAAQRLLDTVRARFIDERTKGYSRNGAYVAPVSREAAMQQWLQVEPRFMREIMNNPEYRQRHGLGEAKDMPDWLKKKISGKSDDDEGGGDDGADDKGEKKSEKSASSTATDVAGGPKESGVGKAKDGDGKVDHTW